MNKFWNKTENSNDIYIYGQIVTESWDETDVTAKSFLDDLSKCGGNVNLHVNSYGGDVFTAQAIYNSLKNFQGDVNVFIEGIAASAASLIICAGTKIAIAKNALVMIHQPSVTLFGSYDAAELEKVKNSLVAVEGSILETYKQRLPEKNHAQVAEMMLAETWLSAEDALNLGFVDEIVGAVEMEVDDSANILFSNSLEVDCKNFGGNFKTFTKGIKHVDNNLTKMTIQDAVNQERQRIKNLMALKNDSASVNAIVDVAISEGADLETAQKYIDAVKAVADKSKNSGLDELKNLVADNLNSGAGQVQASAPKIDPNQEISAEIAKFAKKILGVN